MDRFIKYISFTHKLIPQIISTVKQAAADVKYLEQETTLN